MKVRPKSFDVKALKLSPEEGFVLSRVDAPLSVQELVSLTGLDEGRVRTIVENLAGQGAIEVEGRVSAPPAPSPTTGGSPVAGAMRAQVPSATSEAPPESDPMPQSDPQYDPTRQSDPLIAEGEVAEQPLEESAQADERNYRAIYETKFRSLMTEQRVALAREVEGSDLMAMCLDPDPQVINAILTNPKQGFDHARMIAFHHRTQVGIEILARRNDLLVDAQVQRRLLANPQLPDPVLRKIVGPKLIMDVYKIAINREIPERTRLKTREQLTKKFTMGSAEERAALLIKTEGRCLIILVGCALDVRTTQILTAKTTYSILFIQNLARWSATPPALLTHLLKQPLVRQNIGLRKMLLKHPNMPAEIKRSFQ